MAPINDLSQKFYVGKGEINAKEFGFRQRHSGSGTRIQFSDFGSMKSSNVIVSSERGLKIFPREGVLRKIVERPQFKSLIS